jgi:hypothetical protein
MFLLIFGYESPIRTTRYALTQCVDFECAVKFLSDAQQTHPVYYIVAGVNPNEGVIITKDHFKPAHIERLTEEKWYLYQTNEDHFSGKCNDRC